MSTLTKILKCFQSLSVACLPLYFLASCGDGQKVNCIIRITNLDNIKLSQGGVWSGDKLNLKITSENELIIIDSVKSILNGEKPLTPDQWSFTRVGESNDYFLVIEKGIITGNLNIELEYHEVSPEIKYQVTVLTEGVTSSVVELPPEHELNTILTSSNETLIVNEILSVTINKKPFSEYSFNYDNSELKIDSQYIDGDIEISVQLVKKEFSVTTETEEEITISSSANTVANRENLITELSLPIDKIYAYSINSVEVYIGESETCLEDISFHVDQSHLYKASLEVNSAYITDDIRIVVILQANVPGTYTIMFTDGYTELISKKRLDGRGFKSDPIVLEDKTKKIDKVVATVTDPETETTRDLVVGDEFTFDYSDCIFVLSPNVKGNVTVSIYVHPVSEDLKFENEDWTLLSYWAHCGWDHFSYTYNETEQTLLGKVRQLTMNDGETYNVFVMGIKHERIAGDDPHEGIALMTFQFDRCYAPHGGVWTNYFCQYSDPNGWSYDRSTVYTLFAEGGPFSENSPEWLKKEPRKIARYINEDLYDNLQIFPLGSNDIDPDRETEVSSTRQFTDSGCNNYYRVDDPAELRKRRNQGRIYWMPASLEGKGEVVDLVQAIGIVNEEGKTHYTITDIWVETSYAIIPCFCL